MTFLPKFDKDYIRNIFSLQTNDEPYGLTVYYEPVENINDVNMNVTGQPIKENFKENYTKNPKRLQRDINRQLLQRGVRAKAQEAISLQQEQNKLKKKKYNSAKLEEKRNKKFELRQVKKKEKHKGH